jgi:hypothetical protein
MSSSKSSSLPYPGPPLDPFSIRLFKFDRDDEGQIHGRLKAHALEDHEGQPSWIALSYTWDTYRFTDHELPLWDTQGHYVSCRDRRKHIITVNGQPFPVQTNLWNALNAICNRMAHGSTSASKAGRDRAPNSPFRLGSLGKEVWYYFWIDSICIDQGNILERSRQVNLMKSIYSKALFVLVWLAPDDLAPSSAEVEDRLSRALRVPPYEIQSDEEIILTDPKANQDIRGILMNAYWDRMWILQEIMLAKHVMCLYGNLWLNGRFWAALSRLSPPFNIKSFRLMRRLSGLQKLTLFPLLEEFCEQKCSDPRDRIYGLLGVLRFRLDGRGKCGIFADYSLSAYDIFLQVVYHERKDIFGSYRDGSYRDENSTIRVVVIALGLDEQDLLVRATIRYYQLFIGSNKRLVEMHECTKEHIWSWLLDTQEGTAFVRSITQGR